jgi:1-deoxy-D-xylulose-5-phosphate synthase
VGADGPTHQGAFDIAFLRCIPNMVLMVPSDENECRQMLYTGHKLQKPAAVRYPRGSATGVVPEKTMTALALGKSRTIRTGEKVAILNFGILLPYAQQAAEKINATVIDMRFVKPLDTNIIEQLAAHHDLFVSIEDGAIMGGAGSAVAEFLISSKHSSKLLTLGLPDEFIMQGTQQEMYAELGLDSAGILSKIATFNSVV